MEGLAQATGAPSADVRRAVMLAGSLQTVAERLLADGPEALAAFRLTVGRPVQPMLAHSASVRHRGDRQARRLRGRGEAGRHPRPGPPRRRRRTPLHPHPGRHHGPAARTHLRRKGVEGRALHPRRRGHRVRRGRAAAVVPGHRRPRGLPRGRRHGRRGRPRLPRLLRRALRGRPRTARPAVRRPPRGTGPSGPRADARTPHPRGRPGGRAGAGRRRTVPRRHAGARPRGRRAEGPRRPLQRGPPRSLLAEGQARTHPGPGRAGRRVGPRATHRQALQPASGRPQSGRLLRHAGQDLQRA